MTTVEITYDKIINLITLLQKMTYWPKSTNDGFIGDTPEFQTLLYQLLKLIPVRIINSDSKLGDRAIFCEQWDAVKKDWKQ